MIILITTVLQEETYTIDETGPAVTAHQPGVHFPTLQSVTLSSHTHDLDAIYYTTDGTEPDNTPTEYTCAIHLLNNNTQIHRI